MPKKLCAFRLPPGVVAMLSELVDLKGQEKTVLVEKAIGLYYRHEKDKQNALREENGKLHKLYTPAIQRKYNENQASDGEILITKSKALEMFKEILKEQYSKKGIG